jgi:hypothetical protein
MKAGETGFVMQRARIASRRAAHRFRGERSRHAAGSGCPWPWRCARSRGVAEARRSSLAIVQLAAPEICWELVAAHLIQGKGQNDTLDDAPKAFLDLLMAQDDRSLSNDAEKNSSTVA